MRTFLPKFRACFRVMQRPFSESWQGGTAGGSCLGAYTLDRKGSGASRTFSFAYAPGRCRPGRGRNCMTKFLVSGSRQGGGGDSRSVLLPGRPELRDQSSDLLASPLFGLLVLGGFGVSLPPGVVRDPRGSEEIHSLVPGSCRRSPWGCCAAAAAAAAAASRGVLLLLPPAAAAGDLLACPGARAGFKAREASFLGVP